jgi:hypothetical protein
VLELRLQHRLRLSGRGLVRTGRRPSAAAGLARGGLIAFIGLVALSGCGQGGPGGDPQGSSYQSSPPRASAAGTAPPAGTAPRTSARHGVSAAAAPSKRRGGSRLAYSSASAQVVQAQPAPGSCHAIGSGLYSRPDPHCTPGALNPAVTQATIGHTICRSGWTKTVRPSARITDREKAGSMAAYGDPESMSGYEYDHFVPLELGGAVNDARNLWPEPGGSPNPKDAIENDLRRQVCYGQRTLAQAQRAIAANWVALSRTTPSPGRSTSTAAHCTVSAAYSSRYHDYDVYVHSNQPDQTVVVTDAAGNTARWHTDASGYADVFLRAPADEAGQAVTAHIGGGSCQGAL